MGWIHQADQSRYLPADDLGWERICRQHRHANRVWKPGRMVVETSPQSYRVWIRSQRELSLPEKRYWLKRLGSDPGADPNNRWGRCPGFRNRKEKHRSAPGQYPLAKLIWIDWTGQAQIPHITTEARYPDEPLSRQPPRGVCVEKAISSARTMNAPASRRRIFPTPWRRPEEDMRKMKYQVAFYRRGQTGIIIEESEESIFTWTGQSEGQKQ
jgi:hypothetical protein